MWRRTLCNRRRRNDDASSRCDHEVFILLLFCIDSRELCYTKQGKDNAFYPVCKIQHVRNDAICWTTVFPNTEWTKQQDKKKRSTNSRKAICIRNTTHELCQPNGCFSFHFINELYTPYTHTTKTEIQYDLIFY